MRPSWPRKAWPTSVSQGQRSSSVSAIPADIFATLEAGCSLSPSVKDTPSRAAIASPTDVLPQLATPITTAAPPNIQSTEVMPPST